MWRILGRVGHNTTSFGPSQWILKGLRVYLASTLRVRDFVKKLDMTLTLVQHVLVRGNPLRSDPHYHS